MKNWTMLGLAVLTASVVMAFAASGASATTLEVAGVTQSSSVTLTLSLKTEASAILRDTEGFSFQTCTASDAHGNTTVFTGSVVTGPLTGHNDGRLPSSGFSVGNCTRPFTVHDPGTLEISHIAGTTDGTVASEETEMTVGTPFGFVNCKTGATTHFGRLTGATTASNPGAHATLDVNAVLGCGFLLPSAKWEGTYTVTTPTDLGVSA